MSRVEGKVAIVTGAASGLGLASSKKLIQEGARVVLTDINQQGLETIKEHLSEFSETQYSTEYLDVTSEESWQEIIEKVELEYGKINILINSAGISLGSDIVSTDFEVWKKVHQVNLDSVFLGCKYAIPKIAAYGPGSIINLSSISGIVAGWNTAAYNSSKAGVRLLTKSVALYCAKKGYDVRCNSIHPAFVNTPILDPIKQAFGDDEAVRKLARQIPMNKIGDTDDVAYAVLYLASDESKFMTGSEIILDGGLSAM
jgi:NAD(P)-dependent dehydrogenase (short-subunit alcohol dehydrogenase family)|tara:strand:- start:380 stop:1150 length:771 start_codon:yes stop_codon:yes gene_type:complete